MNCEETQAVFVSHLDGEELQAEVAEAMDRHLAECTACRAAATKMAETHRDLLLLRVTEATPKLSTTEVKERQRRSTEDSLQPAQRPSFWIETAAAVVLAAVMAYLLWPEGLSTYHPTENGSIVKPAPDNVSGNGRVVEVQGQVVGRTDGRAQPVELKVGTVLTAGQEIQTAADSSVVLEVAGGLLICLEASSAVRLGTEEQPTQLFLLKGRGRFEATEPEPLWHIETPNATVEARNGVFTVSVQE